MIIFSGYNHIAINMFLFIMLRRYVEFEVYMLGAIFVVILGAIIVDIDHPNSLINGILIFPFSTVFNDSVKGYDHRALPHTPIAALVVGGLFWLYNPVYGYLMFGSYMMHLICDSCTKAGIKFLYPFSERTYGLKCFDSGGEENLIVLGIVLLLWKIY